MRRLTRSWDNLYFYIYTFLARTDKQANGLLSISVPRGAGRPKKEILVSGRKENNVIHCFSNEGSPSRNVCSFFILHNIEKAFLEKSNPCHDVSQNIFRTSVFLLTTHFLDSLFSIKNFRKFFLEPIYFPRFTQLEVTG